MRYAVVPCEHPSADTEFGDMRFVDTGSAGLDSVGKDSADMCMI